MKRTCLQAAFLYLPSALFIRDRDGSQKGFFMADKKKNSHRSQTAALKTPSRKQSQAEKSIKVPAPEDQQLDQPVLAKSAKTSALEGQLASVPTKDKAPAREERRRPRPETKATARRETKGPPRWRKNAAGRFIYDAYYELRHKVTWPTLKEAKNMTLVVIALSAVVGGIIALADYGLHELFIFIVTKSWSQ
jgi:preprotein translocase SecE subunit